MLTYKRFDSLHIEGYTDSDYVGMKESPRQDTYSLSQEELYREKAQSKPSLHRPQYMPSL